MPVYLWLAFDEDASHDWFTASHDEAAIERARELCLPAFDSMHVRSMTFDVWSEHDERFVGSVAF